MYIRRRPKRCCFRNVAIAGRRSEKFWECEFSEEGFYYRLRKRRIQMVETAGLQMVQLESICSKEDILWIRYPGVS